VQLADDRHIQALLREQNLDVAPAPRCRDGGVEQRLGEKAARKREGPEGRLVRPVAALKACHALDFRVGQRRRPEDQTAAGCVFEGDARLHDLRVFFEGGGESGIEGDGVSCCDA
jgi:hypothetical protein